MSPTTAAVAIAAAFTLGPVLLLAYQQHQKRERRRWLSVRAWAVEHLIAPAGGVQS